MTNHERAKKWLDAHMRYMPSDLTDLRILLDEVQDDAIRAAAECAEFHLPTAVERIKQLAHKYP